MPGRTTPLVTGQVYHIVNRGVADQPVFLSKKDYFRALYSILYYRYSNIPMRYSFYLRLNKERRVELFKRLTSEDVFHIELLAYCLMPNHIHLLIRQLQNNGTSIFMANFSNSYTKYFNVKHRRNGHLFQGKFKSIHVGSDEQLIHVSRYIHLNPYSSFVVKNLDGLSSYPYSSLPEYLGMGNTKYCIINPILTFFKTSEAYRKFIFDHADYQRKLERYKHLLLEKY